MGLRLGTLRRPTGRHGEAEHPRQEIERAGPRPVVGDHDPIGRVGLLQQRLQRGGQDLVFVMGRHHDGERRWPQRR